MDIEKAHLEHLLRTKIELEALTDAQIARLLHVGASTVAHWRYKFHIKPADKFKRKFQEKYGPEALESFDTLVREGVTLQEIGHYFGFSREYARQVYNKLYQSSYRTHQRQRAQAVMLTSPQTHRGRPPERGPGQPRRQNGLRSHL
jgi:hypothetical protein